MIRRTHSVGNEILSSLKTVKKVPATHIRCKNQIGLVWATKDTNYHTEIFILLLLCLGYHTHFWWILYERKYISLTFVIGDGGVLLLDV